VPAPERPEERPPTAVPTEPTAEPTLPAGRLAALGGETVAMAAPNMVGNSLGPTGFLTFLIFDNNEELSEVAVLPLPGIGGAKIFKVADNSSPIPRDRVFFNYHHYHNAYNVTSEFGPLVRARNVNDDTFLFGLERTFLDGCLSAEVRVPFSQALSSSQRGNTSVIETEQDFVRTVDLLDDRDTEFGDVAVAFKALLYRDWHSALAAGLGITFPTADDVQVQFADQAFGFVEETRVDVNNGTTFVSPYIGFLATPNCRIFIQGFAQVDFPIGENEVSVRRSFTIDQSPPVVFFRGQGELESQMTLALDLQVGYWLYRCPEAGCLNGVAALVELHYLTALEDADILTLGEEFGEAILVGNTFNRFDFLNLTAGFTFEIGNRSLLTIAGVAPLRDEDDRTFDAELQIQFNYFF
jgi:hypothetical protein